MKVKAFLTAAVLSTACVLSSCGNNDVGETVENNFAEILSAGEVPVFINVSLDNVTTAANQFSESIDEFVSVLTSVKLSEYPDSNDLPDSDAALLQIEILRNSLESQQGMDFCLMNFYSDGTLSVFGSEQFVGDSKSYSLSEQDLKKIKSAAEKVAADRTSCPQPMRITDPLSSYSYSGAVIDAADISWSYTDSDRREQDFVADALHPLDENAQHTKLRTYSSVVFADFADGFEPDKLTVSGWNTADKGNTAAEPVFTLEQDEESVGSLELKQNMIYRLTVFYDESKLDERGFCGTADYYFEF